VYEAQEKKPYKPDWDRYGKHQPHPHMKTINDYVSGASEHDRLGSIYEDKLFKFTQRLYEMENLVSSFD